MRGHKSLRPLTDSSRLDPRPLAPLLGCFSSTPTEAARSTYGTGRTLPLLQKKIVGVRREARMTRANAASSGWLNSEVDRAESCATSRCPTRERSDGDRFLWSLA
jgi:hypothetical protein